MDEALYVLIGVNYNELNTSLIVKGAKKDCQDRLVELVKEDLDYKTNITEIDKWVKETRPKITDYPDAPKLFGEALEAHSVVENDKYFALARPTYLGFEFFIF